MSSNKGIGGHQSARMLSDTWLTPPSIIHALGKFDLDPCTPAIMPWSTAAKRYTEAENGLIQHWEGRVWLNPPYGDQAVHWLNKLADHGNGIALTFARTETEMFFSQIWERCNGLLFLKGRLHFHHADGTRAKANAGAPSCLIAYGMDNSECLESCSIPGQYVPMNYTRFIVVGVSPSWFKVVSIAIRHHGDGDLSILYQTVERMAPDKVNANQHWREKIRQQLYVYRKKNAL